MQDRLPLLQHFTAMMGPFGLYQHATGSEPLLSEGYCVDDNARAVQVLLRLLPHIVGENKAFAERAIALCWKFVMDAQHGDAELYNFRDSNGVWLPHDVSADMYARVLRCCATILDMDTDSNRKQEATALARNIILHYKDRLDSVRAWAEALVAISLLETCSVDVGDIASVETYCLDNLIRIWQSRAEESWPWFEDSLSYANALLHHGILHRLNNAKENSVEEDIIKKSSVFLIQTTITKDNIFIPIGNAAWHAKGTEPSIYDQQPIEAGVMLDFLLDLKKYKDSAVTVPQAAAPYLWFFGKNSKHVSLVNMQTGACFDALTPNGPNTNCGAESMLAYLWAEARIREASPDVLEYVEEELRNLNS